MSNARYNLFPSKPAFLAYGTTGWTTVSQGAVVGYGGTTINRDNVFNTTNSRFTAPVDGLYFFGMTSYNDANNASYISNLVLAINGTQNAPSDVIPNAYYGSYMTTGGFTYMLELDANDYVEVRQRIGGNTARLYMNHSHFGGFLVS